MIALYIYGEEYKTKMILAHIHCDRPDTQYCQGQCIHIYMMVYGIEKDAIQI